MKNLFKGKDTYIYTHSMSVLLMPFTLTITEIKHDIRSYKLYCARRSLIKLLNKRVIQLQPIDYNSRCKGLILKLSEDFVLADILDFIFDVEFDYGESEFSMIERKLEDFFSI